MRERETKEKRERNNRGRGPLPFDREDDTEEDSFFFFVFENHYQICTTSKTLVAVSFGFAVGGPEKTRTPFHFFEGGRIFFPLSLFRVLRMSKMISVSTSYQMRTVLCELVCGLYQ